MNPEEGELRPQLLDRFSLHVFVSEILEEQQRVKIIRNNLLFGEDPVVLSRLLKTSKKRLDRRFLMRGRT